MATNNYFHFIKKNPTAGGILRKVPTDNDITYPLCFYNTHIHIWMHVGSAYKNAFWHTI